MCVDINGVGWAARQLETQEMKRNLGPAKGKDWATGMGTYLVSKDELESKRISGPNGDRYQLSMKAFHNGKQGSDGNLKDMIELGVSKWNLFLQCTFY